MDSTFDGVVTVTDGWSRVELSYQAMGRQAGKERERLIGMTRAGEAEELACWLNRVPAVGSEAL